MAAIQIKKVFEKYSDQNTDNESKIKIVDVNAGNKDEVTSIKEAYVKETIKKRCQLLQQAIIISSTNDLSEQKVALIGGEKDQQYLQFVAELAGLNVVGIAKNTKPNKIIDALRQYVSKNWQDFYGYKHLGITNAQALKMFVTICVIVLAARIAKCKGWQSYHQVLLSEKCKFTRCYL
ncbi:MAG: hypothetical protein COC15_03220 [Legionellales bacterium]|nr:MAG: hypothetical protein COC15_03220 [Legionellales bacterium]